MNSKLFARIAAVAVGASMLSSFAFADTASLNEAKDALTLDATAIATATADDATMVTMMAYLVGSDATIATAYADETTTPMVALDQIAKDDIATKLATVNVLASKFTDAFPKAIIKTGHNGTAGEATKGVTWLVELTTTSAGDEKVTIMNGATAIDLTVDSDGYVTLPKTAEFGKTRVDGATITLYSWVAFDNTTDAEGSEYVITGTDDVKVLASDIEGKTLYAKFDTGYTFGDVNMDKSVNSTDTSLLNVYTLRGKTNASNKYIGSAVYEGSTVKIGNINGDQNVNSTDTSLLNVYTLRGKTNTSNSNVGKKLYVVRNVDTLK